MNQIRIQKVEASDVFLLREIAIKTFSETFSNENLENNMRIYLTDSFSIEKLSNELEDSNSEFYFALYDNIPVGYLKLRFESPQTNKFDTKAIEIERIYVLKDFHGKCVGQNLLSYTIEIARKRLFEWICLGVWEKNKRAIQFYMKNGFIEFDKHIFRLGNDEQIDLLMKLSVNEISYQDAICLIKKHLKNNNELSILDFGTGEMDFIKNIQESLKDKIDTIIAIDSEEHDICYSDLGKIELLIQDGFEYLKNTSNKFDVIIFSNVLHSFDYVKQDSAIKQTLSILKDSGIIYIKIANTKHAYSRKTDKFEFNENRLIQVSEIAEIVEIRELEKHFELILKNKICN